VRRLCRIAVRVIAPAAVGSVLLAVALIPILGMTEQETVPYLQAPDWAESQTQKLIHGVSYVFVAGAVFWAALLLPAARRPEVARLGALPVGVCAAFAAGLVAMRFGWLPLARGHQLPLAPGLIAAHFAGYLAVAVLAALLWLAVAPVLARWRVGFVAVAIMVGGTSALALATSVTAAEALALKPACFLLRPHPGNGSEADSITDDFRVALGLAPLRAEAMPSGFMMRQIAALLATVILSMYITELAPQRVRFGLYGRTANGALGIVLLVFIATVFVAWARVESGAHFYSDMVLGVPSGVMLLALYFAVPATFVDAAAALPLTKAALGATTGASVLLASYSTFPAGIVWWYAGTTAVLLTLAAIGQSVSAENRRHEASDSTAEPLRRQG